ncbi:uncharacterized protein LOC131292848 [Anopheles ziemanni]|uniref:uncharacterized protein LOC131271197 n=1 Tax=Anopheles coustani TaxID=139045 RepID=UPI00265B38FA|nr:uncharacterized protein LOC131271197 [Anopheles coustani]XP_058176925.1 uncharacterized protein LOC131292848 [Anopheles ziemanni]
MTHGKPVCRGLRIDCGSCTSVMICNYQNQTVGGYDCASTDPTRPYCTKAGVCSSTIDDSCQIQSDLCPSTSKYYPDPANCANALYCNDEYYASKTSAPSSGYVFNYSSQTWSLRRSPADCFEINCFAAGKQNTWTAYKPDPKLSIYCGTYGPMIFECSGINYIFNESKKQCEFSCVKEGSFPHPTETKLYYLCLPTTNGKSNL